MANAKQEMKGIKSGQTVSQTSNNPRTEQRMETVEAEGDVFQKILTQNHIDLGLLAQDLARLRSELTTRATDPDHFGDIDRICAAESKAEGRNGPEALAILSKVGRWVLDAATKIGATVAAKAIEQSLGVH